MNTHPKGRIYADAAPIYLEQGWLTTAVTGKKWPAPGTTGRHGSISEDVIERLRVERPDDNVAIRHTATISIDVDVYGEKLGDMSLETLTELAGAPLPPTFYSTSRGAGHPSRQMFFRVPAGVHFVTAPAQDIEICQHDHRYSVVWPSVHPDTGNTYKWYDPTDVELSCPPALDMIPELPEEWLRGLRDDSGSSSASSRLRKYVAPYAGDMDQWIENLDDGDPTPGVQKVLDGKPDRYDTMVAALWQVARLAIWESGERGVRTAFWHVARTYIDSRTSGTDAAERPRKVEAALRGAIAKWQHEANWLAGYRTWIDGLSSNPPSSSSTSKIAISSGGDSADATRDEAEGRPLLAISRHLSDSPLAEAMSESFRNRLCKVPGIGWLEYAGGVWLTASEDRAQEAVRVALHELFKQLTELPLDEVQAKKAATLLGVSKIRAVLSLLGGLLERDVASFDAQPDMLCVGNGVVHLPSGQLLPHDPRLLLTRKSQVAYRPNTETADWTRALEAIPESVRLWMQVRLGQAVTGYMTDDDVLPILRGSGADGKSALVNALRSALGDHAVTVPERVLLANPGDHPTELTTLKGARLALIEELPDDKQLLTKRLKDVLGTPVMSARRMRQDNMTWRATHSLFLTTNYVPTVNETDDGTWRRLALVTFPFKFPVSDFRERLARDPLNLEAALAWVVVGAQQWYDRGRSQRSTPQVVTDDTALWRTQSDALWAYSLDRLEFDPGGKVLAVELHQDFNAWQQSRGQSVWSARTFASRFADHELVRSHAVERVKGRDQKGLSRRLPAGLSPAAGATPQMWVGVRFVGGVVPGVPSPSDELREASISP